MTYEKLLAEFESIPLDQETIDAADFGPYLATYEGGGHKEPRVWLEGLSRRSRYATFVEVVDAVVAAERGRLKRLAAAS